MQKIIFMTSILILVLLICFLGCIACNWSIQPDSSSSITLNAPLPDIDIFSSTEYIETKYMFPKIKSAAFCHDGISESISPDDPRLIRLLNSLSFSYEQGYTSWRKGHVEEPEYMEYICSGYPMIDISFEIADSQGNYNEFSNTPRMIVSANRYLLLVDVTKSAWMPDYSIYANEHFPYASLLAEYYSHLSEMEISEMYGNIEWGNNKWIDLLAYAGF